MHISLTRALAAAGLLCISASASAVDFLPRLGAQLGHYTVEGGGDSSSVTFGPTAGLTLSGDTLFADINFEALPLDVVSTSYVMREGWRTELGATLGLRVYDGVALIAGYRTSMYGDSFGSSKLGDNSGPFIGVNFPELRLGSSTRDIMSLSVAVQKTTYTDKSTNTQLDSDVGVNIRVGYRRAGSPHSYGLRYQSFGASTYGEYLTTLQYSYIFSSF